MAAHVLEHGLKSASLRPLAKAAGTSDRMLIYHFGNKERLVAELLNFIAQAYEQVLDASFSGKRATSRRELLDRILSKSAEAEMQPFMALWWEIVAGSARDVPGYRNAAQSVMDQLLAWLETQMPDGDPDPAGGARYLLTLIEGAQMLSAVGRSTIAQEAIATVEL